MFETVNARRSFDVKPSWWRMKRHDEHAVSARCRGIEECKRSLITDLLGLAQEFLRESQVANKSEIQLNPSNQHKGSDHL